MKKNFDCVEMKNRLQEEMREQEQRLGPEEIRRRRQEWLARGDDSLARWWRSIPAVVPANHEALALSEEPADYRIGTHPQP